MQGSSINTGYNGLPALSELEDKLDQLIADLDDGESQPAVLALSLLCAELNEVQDSLESISDHRATLDQRIRQFSHDIQVNIEQYAQQKNAQQMQKLINGVKAALAALEKTLNEKQVRHVYDGVRRSDQIAQGIFDDTQITMASLFDTMSHRLHGDTNGNGQKKFTETLRAPGFGQKDGQSGKNGSAKEHRPTQLGLGDQDGPELERARSTFVPGAPKAPSFQLDLDQIFGVDDDEPTATDDSALRTPAAPLENIADQPALEAAPSADSNGMPKVNGLDDEDSADRTNPNLDIRMVADLIKNNEKAPVPDTTKSAEPVPASTTPAPVTTALPATPDLVASDTAQVTTPPENLRPAPLIPIEIPAGIRLPSQTLRSKPTPPPAAPDNSPYLQYVGKKPTPKGISTTAKAAITAVLMSIAGLSTYTIYRGTNTPDTPSEKAKVALNNTPSANPTNSIANSAPEQKPQPIDQKIEDDSQYESGTYRIDKSYAGYQGYLNRYKQAAGLVQIIKDISGETRINYEQNPAKVASLKAEGKLVLTGNESEIDQRLIAMEGFLATAKTKNLDNFPTVKGFFKNHQASLDRYKKSGTWDKEAVGYGSKEFFELFGKPLKQKAEPGVIGYAMDSNPLTNPALKSVEGFAPTYYKFLRQAADEMQKETDPKKLVTIDNPEDIKKDICARIAALGRASKHENVRNGIGYMNDAWCKQNDASPLNYLNQAVKFTIPIRSPDNTPTSLQKPAPNQNTPNNGTFMPNIISQPQGINQSQTIDAPKPQLDKPTATPTKPVEKPTLRQRLFKGLKSIFTNSEEDPQDQEIPAVKPDPRISRNQKVEEFSTKYGLNRDRSKDYLLYM